MKLRDAIDVAQERVSHLDRVLETMTDAAPRRSYVAAERAAWLVLVDVAQEELARRHRHEEAKQRERHSTPTSTE